MAGYGFGFGGQFDRAQWGFHQLPKAEQNKMKFWSSLVPFWNSAVQAKDIVDWYYDYDKYTDGDIWERMKYPSLRFGSDTGSRITGQATGLTYLSKNLMNDFYGRRYVAGKSPKYPPMGYY